MAFLKETEKNLPFIFKGRLCDVRVPDYFAKFGSIILDVFFFFFSKSWHTLKFQGEVFFTTFLFEELLKKNLGFFLDVSPQFPPKKFSFGKGSLFFRKVISLKTSINFLDSKDKKRLEEFFFSGEKQPLFLDVFFFLFFPNVLRTEEKKRKT